MIRLDPIPPIVLTNNQPAFYDVESVTAIEMISKMYKYLQNWVDDYNKFVTEVNTQIENYENSTDKNIDEFQNCVKELLSNYINSIDTKINNQNVVIQDAIVYIKDHLEETANKLFVEAIKNGDLKATLDTTYNETDESLTLAIKSEKGGN